MNDTPDLHYRPLERDDIARLPDIDRSEPVDQHYQLRDRQLILVDAATDHPGWDQRYYDARLPRLYESFDNDGAGWSVFRADLLVAISLLDGRPIGPARDTLDVTFFHVSRHLRGHGVGRRIFNLTADLARARGARYLYVSSSESRNTVDFYLTRGMSLADPPDPALLEIEPTNIHFKLAL